jgi:hypothetical protein
MRLNIFRATIFVAFWTITMTLKASFELHNQQLYVLYSLTKYHSGDQVKKTDMGRACSTCGGEERCPDGFSGETLGKETTWKTQV